MPEISTIEFQDLDANDRAWVFIRTTGSSIGLALSLEHDGDLEVSFDVDTGLQILEALKRAVEAIDPTGAQDSR